MSVVSKYISHSNNLFVLYNKYLSMLPNLHCPTWMWQSWNLSIREWLLGRMGMRERQSRSFKWIESGDNVLPEHLQHPHSCWRHTWRRERLLSDWLQRACMSPPPTRCWVVEWWRLGSFLKTLRKIEMPQPYVVRKWLLLNHSSTGITCS